MKERNIQNTIRLNCSKGNTRLFNNDQGVAELNGRKIAYGLGKGSTDLVGVHSIVVTPELVGQRIGLAVFAEVKTATGVVKQHQKDFMQTMRDLGCISGVVRSTEDMQKLLEGKT